MTKKSGQHINHGDTMPVYVVYSKPLFTDNPRWQHDSPRPALKRALMLLTGSLLRTGDVLIQTGHKFPLTRFSGFSQRCDHVAGAHGLQQAMKLSSGDAHLNGLKCRWFTADVFDRRRRTQVGRAFDILSG